MATIIMIKSNSSVIIKNHDTKGTKKCSKDGDTSEDDEEGDNLVEQNGIKDEDNQKPLLDGKIQKKMNKLRSISPINDKVENHEDVKINFLYEYIFSFFI